LSGAIGSKIEVPQITWFLPTEAASTAIGHLRVLVAGSSSLAAPKPSEGELAAPQPGEGGSSSSSS
jgi:hypothetical protein